jgi:poly-gamma-glutamate synthesis protein (capsule biosynthesis protein)
MLLRRILFYSLLSVFVTQLCLVDFTFIPTTYTYGETTLLVTKTQKTETLRVPILAEYTSAEKPSDSLIFTGDILLARNIEFLMRSYGSDYPYLGIDFSDLSMRPAVVGNFESSIPAAHVPTPSGSMTFSVDEQHIRSLKEAGFSHLSLANNHTFDYQTIGLESTQSVLSNNQLVSFGHPKEFDTASVEFIEVNNKTIAIIAAHALEYLPNYTQLKEVFSYASFRSDMQIVYVHWGTEYVHNSNLRQKELAERFVDVGADLVVGHHPHVVQNIELINNVPVFYSLGNYIFDQYDTRATQEGLILHLEFVDTETEVTLIPVTSENSLSQPHFMKPKQHADFLTQLANISDIALQASIITGQIRLGQQVASSSKVAIMNP